MQSIAAYYVLVANDLAAERDARVRQDQITAPRRSRVERLATALETLVRLGRPATTQPV